MEKNFNFTIKKLEQLEVIKRTFFYDTKVPGLAIRVSPNGNKTFYLYKHIKKPIKIRLGFFPVMTIFLARQEALKTLSELARGYNRLETNIPEELYGSVTYFYEKYIKYQSIELAESTIEKYERIYKTHLSSFKNKKLIDIKFVDVERLQYQIKENAGPYASNQSITFLSTLFNYANRTGLQVHNPCKVLKKYKEKKRDRYLNLEEVKALINACLSKDKNVSEEVKDYIIFLLYTGVRRRTASTAKLNEFDLKDKLWNIPSEKSKTNQAQKVYLHGLTFKIVEKMHKRKSFFLFPGNGKSGHLEEPKKGYKQLLKSAGIEKEGVTIHTLRHTFITHCYEIGINPLVVSRLGGHKIPGVTANVYGHVSDEKIKEAYKIIADRFYI